jgi:2-amino-4-hydroxy-6-hydroxymethyldihydropteridine diphosphokinase
MGRAFLALGSNLGDREANLRRAVAGIPDVVAVSTVYETEPLGSSLPYLNAVVRLETTLSARDLLEVCRRLEREAGRARDPHDRYAPRTLDVDVLLAGDEVVDEPDLEVPHPRMRERPFVLVPLADVAPDLVPDPPVDPGVRPTDIRLP